MTTLTKTRLRPTRIAPETFVIHDHVGEGYAPVIVPMNAMLIRGAEPVVVDTGAAEHAESFFDDLFTLVDPEDIRWVFISHDDIDHTGNVNALMEAAPNATLVIDFFMAERMGASLEVAPARQRWISDGDTIFVGDRHLEAVQPPVYDSPTTRGLYDTSSGVFWGSDAYATPMPTVEPGVEALDPAMWAEGFATFAHWVSPWLRITDGALFASTCRRIERLGVTTIAGCHTPVIGPRHVHRALELMRAVPSMPYAPQPDQTLLDEITAGLATAAS